jgi:hypothetical protein
VTETLISEVVEAVRRHPRVSAVTLVGSRAENTATPLSDWDFVIESPEPQSVFEDLPLVIASFDPLGAFWDPLADTHRNYIVMFPSLVTLDLHLDLPPPTHSPWTISRETLPAIDTHFWNWTLWLKGKALQGRDTLVGGELVKMHRYLLEPLGCDRAPATIREATSLYIDARGKAERDSVS